MTATQPPIDMPMSTQVIMDGAQKIHFPAMLMTLFLSRDWLVKSPDLIQRLDRLHSFQQLQENKDDQYYSQRFANKYRGP
jgi:hypothetical protein